MSAPFRLDFLARRPYSDFHPRFSSALTRLRDWPEPAQYDELASAVPQAPGVTLPRFVVENRQALQRAGGYENHVATLSAVPTRPHSWHDFFNMSVWGHFPRLRWALNALHVDDAAGPADPRNRRAPAQNLAATLDETGMLVASTSRSLLEELRALRFKVVFWERRTELLATTRFYLVGHGLLESLLTPHPRLAARSLLLHVPTLSFTELDQQRFELDSLAAARIHRWRERRAMLDPLPVLAIPGYADNGSASFYDDPVNQPFRPVSSRPPSTTEHFE
ncbi:MAG TPA: DUF3025 domain-containing protein [Polyangiaceae bacterium]|nr:DUF3025 domain-containing protein [Polyangiaceae bacterium]